MENKKLFKAVAVLAILVLTVVILVYAKPFLVPITFASVLSMVLLPVTKWLRGKGVGKVISVLLSVFSLLVFLSLFLFFISLQISNIASDATELERQLTEKYHQAQKFVSEHLNISPERQDEMIKEQQASSTDNMGSTVAGLLAGIGGFLANTLLVLVYVFLFIYFRSHLKGFIVRLVPKEQEEEAVDVVNKVQKVSEQYLSGMFMMIVCLWIMYGIGFTIIGVKNAVFFAVLCGLLEIVPFVGNLTGTVLTVSMSLVQGGGMSLVVGILITYGLVQFIQTYLLEPLVVGAEVNINPLFTIVGLVAFQILWGIAGMILAIPLVGMFKIVCDHVEPLKPYAYLIGSSKNRKGSIFKKKIKNWGKKLKDKIN